MEPMNAAQCNPRPGERRQRCPYQRNSTSTNHVHESHRGRRGQEPGHLPSISPTQTEFCISRSRNVTRGATKKIPPLKRDPIFPIAQHHQSKAVMGKYHLHSPYGGGGTAHLWPQEIPRENDKVYCRGC